MKTWQDQSVLVAGLGSIGQRHTRLLHSAGVKTIFVCDAVDGHIPEYDELKEESRSMYRMQGLHRDRLPADKEEAL